MDKRATLILALFLGIFTLAIFWPVTGYDFVVFDDHLYVTDAPQVQQGLTWQGVGWAFRTCRASNWHPLVWLSHMLDCSLFGLFPGGHHLTSLLFHVANTVLLFLLLKRLTGTLWRSALVAALFGWHPLHVESVAWIAERKDVLSTLFWILTLLAYAGFAEQPSRQRYWSTVVLFALGLLCKPMLVTLPCVLLLLDYWPLNRVAASPAASDATPHLRGQALLRRWLELVLEKWPFFALSAASCVTTIWAQHKGGAMQSLEVLPLRLRCVNALAAYGAYIAKAVWPVHLTAFYPLTNKPPFVAALCSGLLLLALSGVALRWRLRRPALLVGWLWFLGTLVPVIGLVQVGAQSMADRYTYVPLIGLSMFVLWMVPDWNPSLVLERPLKIAASGFSLAACAWLTIHQITYWQDGVTLFAQAARCSSGNYLVHNYLGTALSLAGRNDEAVAELSEALRLNPNCAPAHFTLATELARQGQTPQAIAHLTEVLRLNPTDGEAHNNLGIMLGKEGRLEEAVAHFQSAIDLKPEYLKAHLNLATALNQLGKTDQAIARYQVALRLEPLSPEPLDKLAWLMATHNDPRFRDGPRAVALALRSAKLSRNSVPAYLDTLAAAYAEAGLFREAIATGQQALQMAAQTGEKELSSEIQNRLHFYLEGKAYHDRQ